MTRKEIYQKIKEEGLSNQIKNHFKKSYTNVKTEDLEKWLKSNDFAKNKMDNILEKAKVKTIKVKKETYEALYDGFQELVSTLVAHRAITPREAEDIMDAVFK